MKMGKPDGLRVAGGVKKKDGKKGGSGAGVSGEALEAAEEWATAARLAAGGVRRPLHTPALCTLPTCMATHAATLACCLASSVVSMHESPL